MSQVLSLTSGLDMGYAPPVIAAVKVPMSSGAGGFLSRSFGGKIFVFSFFRFFVLIFFVFFVFFYFLGGGGGVFCAF